MRSERDPVTRRQFVKGIGAAAATGVASAVLGPFVIASDKAGRKYPIVGAGEHTYEAIHDWISPPKYIRWGDTHGLCQDSQGRIYVCHTVHPRSPRGDSVLVFDEKGRWIRSWGADLRGGATGLDIRKEGGEEFLYHCDIHGRRVVKTSLLGEVVWEKSFPKEAGVYEKVEQFRPTNVAFAPNGDFYVADGYGSSYIHQYDLEGSYIRTFGSPGSGEGQLSCPHGLWVDDRGGSPALVVADRSNRRLQYFTLDGQHLRFVKEGIRRPCHFKTRGDLLLVPDLDSVVMILDRQNRVIASLGDGHPTQLRGAPRNAFIPGKFIHPHDAIFLRNGDILVAEWVPIGRITLLKKASA